MKKFFHSLWAVAALATVFVGCSKDEAESPANKPREISMSVIAGSELETSPESRTTLNDDNSISWETSGEFLRVFETAGETTSSSKSEEALIDAGKAVFNVSFTENTSATSFTYNAVYPESAWVTSNNTDANNMKLITPTNQLPTATSFDGDADLLIAYPEQRDAQPTELQVRFKRIVAVGKMTLKNLNSTEAITSVEFIAPENKNVTGRSYVNLNEGTVTEYGYSDMHYNNVVMNYDASLEMQSGMTAYFTCFPFEILAGETFKVVVTTPSKVFTREVTIPDGRSLAFTEGRASVFSVDMSAATEEALETLEGEYVAIVKQGTTYYALASTNTNSSTRLDAKEVAYNGTDQTINVNDPTLVWTIAKSGDNYTLSNNNMFVSYSGSSNTAEMSDTEYLLNISKTGDGLYTIGSVSKTDRMLEKNKSSKYFAFYTGTQDGDFYLVKFDGEAQVPTATPIGEITTEGNYTAEGTVVARGSQAYIIADNTGAMMVYHKDNERTVGEKISISGEVTIYNAQSTPQFSASATVEVLSSDNKWTYNPTKMDGAAMDALLSASPVCKEIEFEGNLVVDGNYVNVTIPGASTAIGSVKYIDNSTVAAYDGKDVIVKGYFVGTSSSKFVNVLPYSVEEANPSTDPAIKADPTSLSFAAAGESKEVTYTAENLGENKVFATVSGENASQFSATVGNGTVTVTALENTETTAKTATLTLYIAASEGGEHLAEAIVALTQAGVSSGESKLYTLTILPTDFSGTSYADNNKDRVLTATAEDGSTMDVTINTNQVMLMSNLMQWQKSKGTLYNKTNLGKINSVTLDINSGSFTVYEGSTENPSSTSVAGTNGIYTFIENSGYFSIKVGNATGKLKSITITFNN